MRKYIFFFALSSISLAVEPALSQGASNYTCLVKHDVSGGTFDVSVNSDEVGPFLAAGFERSACPAEMDVLAAKLLQRCERLAQQTEAGQEAIQRITGLSVAEICVPVQSWASQFSGKN